MVPSKVHRFAWFVLLYNLAVIIWGAYVRATGSGAGCGEHWPLCNGTVVPREAEIATLIEFSHRLTSGLSLILVVALALLTFRVFPKASPARKAAVWSVVFILMEAAIGAGLVLLGLVAKNDSVARAWSLALHLTNTFLLLGALASSIYFTAPKAKIRKKSQRFWALSLLAFGGTMFIGMSGGVAALGDTLFPATAGLSESIRADFSAASHWLIRLRFWHPIIAVIVSIYLLIYARTIAVHGANRGSVVLSILVLAQIGLGLVNVMLQAPVWMQLIHLLFADLLWLALVWTALTEMTRSDSKQTR